MDHTQFPAIPAALLVLFPIIMLVFVIITMLPYWFIWKKAGFSPWMSLLMLIPLLNLVMLYVLAFSEWRVVPVPRPAYPYYPPSSLPPQI